MRSREQDTLAVFFRMLIVLETFVANPFRYVGFIDPGKARKRRYQSTDGPIDAVHGISPPRRIAIRPGKGQICIGSLPQSRNQRVKQAGTTKAQRIGDWPGCEFEHAL